MKKILSLGLILVLALALLAGCSKPAPTPAPETPDQGQEQPAPEAEPIELSIGVSPDPHAKIVEVAAAKLAEQGINVKIVEFTDYVRPNHALADGELDANYFQHRPYLDDFSTNENLDLVELGPVHIEPMALYADGVASIDDIPEGAEIAIPNDPSNGGRALLLLQANGLIKLKEGSGLLATEKDIVENPKNIKVTPLEAATLPRVYKDIDGAVINGNYALEAGLHPLNDSVVVEGSDSPYVNIVAVRTGEENEEKFVKLLEALQSDEVKQFIIDTYDGAVVPAF